MLCARALGLAPNRDVPILVGVRRGREGLGKGPPAQTNSRPGLLRGEKCVIFESIDAQKKKEAYSHRYERCIFMHFRSEHFGKFWRARSPLYQSRFLLPLSLAHYQKCGFSTPNLEASFQLSPWLKFLQITELSALKT